MEALNLSTIAATAGLGGALTLLFSVRDKIQLWLTKLAAIVIADIHVTGDAPTILRYLCETSRRFSLSPPRVISGRAFYKPTQKLVSAFLYNLRTTHIPVIYVSRRAPWIFSVLADGDYGQVNIHYFRPLRFGIHRMLREIQNDLDSSDTSVSRFSTRTVTGSLGGGGLNLPVGKATSLTARGDNDQEPQTITTTSDGNTLFPVTYRREDLQPADQNRLSVENSLAMTDDMRTAIKEVEFWFSHRDWYAARDIPWKRGFLLKGTPGNGKTSFIRAMAQTMQLPLIVFDLGSMTNADLVLLWERYTADHTIVAVFEDIDNIFHGRVNTQARGDLNPVTFDCLLNVLDGARTRHGVLTMMTTNDESVIDPALIRPGRVDRVIDFPLPSREGRLVIVRKILGDEHQSLFDEMISKGDGMSGAEFQETCRELAQQLLWEKIK